MYKMINKFGNVVKEVHTERKRDELLKLGYKEIIPEPPKPKRKSKGA